MRDFRRLEVWHEAIALAQSVYETTGVFPRQERFGLTAQMRSAAVSVSSNIAEGAGRGSAKEMARFLRIAVGSICELDSQAELAGRLGYLDLSEGIGDQADLLRRSVTRLIDRVSSET